jgi:peptidyl-prolyl cis-trans isomerase D
MLQSIGDSLKGYTGSKWRKWFAYLVLGLLSVIFAAWGAYGIVNLNFGGSNYAAEANGVKIPLEDAHSAWLREQTQWQQRLGGAELPAELRSQLQNQVLESLIRNALLDKRTESLGYRVSHDALREAVQSEPAFQVEGQYSPEMARAALAQAGIPLEVFERELRTEIQRLQLEGGIRGSDFLTPTELKRMTELQDQEREVRYLALPADQSKAATGVDDAAVQAYYKAHLTQYMTAESDHLQYAELRLDALAAQQSVSEADLRAAYDKEKSRLLVPEKRHARHILITGKDDAAALAQVQQVLAQLKAGKDFGALAQQYSQDPGSAPNGGDLGYSERGSFVKPFADALFAMSVGEIKGPVKTQFGYHIIRLDEVQPAKVKTFEEARPELEAELRRNTAGDRFGEIQEQLQSKLDQAGGDLTALTKEFNLQGGEVPQFLRGAGGAPLGVAQPIQDLVFGDSALQPGRIGGPVILGEDRLVLVKVLEHHKPEPKPLAEVRDGIVAAIKKERGSQAALKAAQEAEAKLDSGTPFDAVAKELGVPSDPARFVGRNDPKLPPQLRDLVFNSPKPGEKPVYRAVPLGTGGAALLAVTNLRTQTPEADKDKQTKALQAKQDAEMHGQADAAAYVEEVRRTADVRKNPKAFE